MYEYLKYLGKRIKHSLFWAKENELINVHVNMNGDLNIMRKVVRNNIYELCRYIS